MEQNHKNRHFLPDTHLRLSVLISLGNSSGSGFLYRTEKSVYLVTAKHVVLDDSQNIRSNQIEIVSQTHNSNTDEINRFRIDIADELPIYSKRSDVAIVKFADVIGTEGQGRKIQYLKNVEVLQEGKFKAVTATREALMLFDEVGVGKDIFLFGYPTSIGLETSRQFDSTKPLIRKGIVANVHESAKTIILDCPVYGGNSGGPVVQLSETADGKEYHVIGIVSQYIPYVQKWRNDRERIIHTEHQNSGFSVATSVDAILELINE